MEKFGSEIRDGKILIRDWKKFGSGMEKIRIQDPEWKKFGSGINIPDTLNTGNFANI
jgi:hypothetical protein